MVVVGLLVGTLYYQLSDSQTSIRARFGMIYFVLTFGAMGAIQSIPALFQQVRLKFRHNAQHPLLDCCSYISPLAVRLLQSVVSRVLFRGSLVHW